MKRCAACQLEKPFDDFYRNAKSKDGYQSYCKACCLASVKRWQRAHPERTRRQRQRSRGKLQNWLTAKLCDIRRRCRHKGETTDLTLEGLLELWERQGGHCALTGDPMTWLQGAGRLPTNLSIDRIDNTRGYTADNIQFVCDWANTAKNQLSVDEFVRLCQRVVSTNRKRRRNES